MNRSVLIHIICILIVLFLFAFKMLAQKEYGSPLIKNFSSTDYGGDSQIYAIAEGSTGLIYLGNANGVREYDGNTFRLYITGNHTTVYSMDTDSLGTVYVGASGDFGYMEPDNKGQLRYISLSEGFDEKEKEFGNVEKTLVCTHGIYFISRKVIFKFYNDTITKIKVNLKSKLATKINDRIYLFDQKEGLCFLNDTTIEKLKGCRELMQFPDVINAISYPDNKILFSSYENGFFLYDIENGNLQRYKTIADEYCIYHKINFAIRVDENKFAVATHTGGILILTNEGELEQLINVERGLSGDDVYKLFFDKTGNLWAGTVHGFSRIDLSYPLTTFSKSQNIDNYVLSTAVYNGRRYLGTYDGLFYLPDYKINLQNDNHKFERIQSLQTNACWDLIEYENSLLGLGKFGIAQIEGTEARVIDSIGYLLCSNYSPKFPNILFVGHRFDFSALTLKKDKRTGKVLIEKKFSFEGLDFEIRKITPNKDGDLWINSRHNGTYFIRFNGNDITDFQITKFGKKDGLPVEITTYTQIINDTVYNLTFKGPYKAILPDKNNYYDSLIYFVPDTFWGEKFTRDSTFLCQIFEYTDSSYMLNAYPVEVITFRKDGTTEVDSVSYKRIPNAFRMYLENNEKLTGCTNNKFIIFDLKKKKDLDIPYNSLIRNVTTVGDSVLFDGAYYDVIHDKFFKRRILTTKQPEDLIPVLPYIKNSISFVYSSSYFEASEANTFQYKLEGFNQGWSKWSKERKTVYTNLPEGEYTFRVKARNIFLKEGKEGIYSFIVLSPWYRTYIAYMAYFLLLILIIYVIVKLYTKRLKEANIRLEEIIKERTTEIRNKNTQLIDQKEEIQAQNERIIGTNKQLESMNEELKKLSLVASETNNAIAIMDAKGDYEWVNEGFVRLHEYELEEFIEEKGKNLLDSSTHSDIRNNISKCIKEKKPVIYQSENISKSNKKIWTQTTLTPILDDRGSVSKLITIEADIREIKKYEKEIALQRDDLARAIAVKDKFFAIISHDLKSPFNAMLGFSEILAENIPYYSKEKIAKFNNQIFTSAKQLFSLVNNLLEWARTKSGEMKNMPEEINLERLVDDIISISRITAGQKNIQIGQNILPEIFVYADSNLVSTVIRNLLSNAIKFSEENSEIIVTAKEIENFIRISVTDSGVGISKEDISKLFREDIHYTTTGTKKEKGTGLGLILCKEFVEISGGKIWVESDIGKGTTFCFTLQKIIK